MNEKIVRIQSELKAPKSQTNSFGGYKYRNCEDILEAVKPLLKKESLRLVISDEVINIGKFNYIKAVATLTDDQGIQITSQAMAREAETKKGMDDAQITGAASSYARKYALNGLFAIDDTKDADSQDNTTQAPKNAVQPTELSKAKGDLQKALKSFGHDNEVKMKVVIKRVLQKSTVDTVEEANEVMQALEDGLV